MKLSEIISLKSAGALAAIFLLFFCPETGNPLTQCTIYIGCITYCLWYGHSAYYECSDPVMQAEQKQMIENMDRKIKNKLRRKT